MKTEIFLPFDQAQEIAMIILGELGIRTTYRLLESRVATRYSPGRLRIITMTDKDFRTADTSRVAWHGEYGKGVWVAFANESDYAMFKLRCAGLYEYLVVS